MKGFIAMLVLLTAVAGMPVEAEIRTRTVEYQHDGKTLQGFLAWDDAIEDPRPGVMVVHEWWGLNDYIRQRTRMLAELGFVAFAADMYGGGQVTEHGSQAGEWMKQITANIAQWQARAIKGLEVLRSQEMVQTDRIAAVGYCFGGATVMQMAYTGVDVDGVVSFHGSLPVPGPEQAENIRAAVLAFHGSKDDFVPRERVTEFQQALEGAGVDWHMVIHGGARHGFTNPGADKYGVDNIKYDAAADRRSWEHMQSFLDDLFGQE